MPVIRAGDEVAWNQICEKLRFCLTHKARKLLADSTTTASLSAEDLVQESLLKGWKSVDQFEGTTTAQFTAWLFKIIHNTFLDWCKSPKMKAAVNLRLTWFDFVDGADSPSKIAIDNELESRLYACIAELNAETQQVILRRHFDGLKFKQIAEQLQMNPNTAASHYRRGVEELKNQIGEIHE